MKLSELQEKYIDLQEAYITEIEKRVTSSFPLNLSVVFGEKKYIFIKDIVELIWVDEKLYAHAYITDASLEDSPEEELENLWDLPVDELMLIAQEVVK